LVLDVTCFPIKVGFEICPSGLNNNLGDDAYFKVFQVDTPSPILIAKVSLSIPNCARSKTSLSFIHWEAVL
jgi:hypothetical protein